MKKVGGVLAVLFGAAIGIWVFYLFATGTMPEGRTFKGLRGLVVAGVMIWVGVKWLRE